QRPVAPFVLIVGSEADLVAAVVRLNFIDLFVVVALAVDEGDEQSSGLGTQYILEDAGLQVVLELVACRILAVLQQVRIAASGRGAVGFLEVVICRVGKAEDRLSKALAEFVFFGQEFQTIALGLERRDEDKVAFT